MRVKWQYKVIPMQASHSNQHELDMAEAHLTDVLGAEGWEVAGVSPSRQQDTHIVILKRPVQEP